MNVVIRKTYLRFKVLIEVGRHRNVVDLRIVELWVVTSAHSRRHVISKVEELVDTIG